MISLETTESEEVFRLYALNVFVFWSICLASFGIFSQLIFCDLCAEYVWQWFCLPFLL